MFHSSHISPFNHRVSWLKQLRLRLVFERCPIRNLAGTLIIPIFFEIFLSPSSHMPGYYLKLVMTASFWIPSNSLFSAIRSSDAIWLELLTVSLTKLKRTKQTPCPVVLKQTIPTERPPLVGEVSANYSG
jgi:hypothetical protein